MTRTLPCGCRVVAAQGRHGLMPAAFDLCDTHGGQHRTGNLRLIPLFHEAFPEAVPKEEPREGVECES